NSAILERYQDGTVWAATFNSDAIGDGTSTTAPSMDTTFSQQLQMIMNLAIYGAATLTVGAGTPQTAPVNTPFATPLQAVVQGAFGDPVAGAAVTLAAPAARPRGTFPGGATLTAQAQRAAAAALLPHGP